MPDAESQPLALFPLGIVLVPGEVVPLHIFEERYKLLVNERRDEGEFGVVLAEEDGVREIGCTATVVDVLEELEDGRMNILVQGHRRFRLLELVQPDDPENEYLSGVVEEVPDEPEDVPEALRRHALEIYRRMLALMEVDAPRDPGGEEPLSYRIVAAVDFGTALKQEVLESTSEEERLASLTAVMETLLPRLELRREREEAIRGNGKGY
jgi:Lon protease-like protein